MKISTIISNYNYAQYLPAAIESVLMQTYKDLEIIVVDDGSTDDSRQVITHFQQKYPDKIKSIFQTNQGQGAAFNAGFEVSSGEIIAFLDADDVWKPNKIQRIVETFNASDVVGIMHQFDTIDKAGNLIHQGFIKRNLPSEDLAKLILDTGNAWWYPPTSALAYRRSALEKVLPMDTFKWRLCADGCLVYCTAFLGKIIALNEVLASYRIHGDNNHASNRKPGRERQSKSQAGIEMTNRYLNEFLQCIGYRERVDLSRNLSYRRTKYYLQGKWNPHEMFAISDLILRWPFYNSLERVNYLARFLIKSMGFLVRPIFFMNKITLSD